MPYLDVVHFAVIHVTSFLIWTTATNSIPSTSASFDEFSSRHHTPGKNGYLSTSWQTLINHLLLVILLTCFLSVCHLGVLNICWMLLKDKRPVACQVYTMPSSVHSHNVIGPHRHLISLSVVLHSLSTSHASSVNSFFLTNSYIYTLEWKKSLFLINSAFLYSGV